MEPELEKHSKKPCFSLYGWWYTKIPPTWLVVTGALIVQVGFGLYPVIVKKFATGEAADPIVLSFYRDALCSPLLFLCALVAERKILIPKPSMLLVLIVLGFVGMFGNQLLYILGVYWAGPDIASAFQPIIPVWTTILALVTCTEKLPSPFHLHTWFKLLGILLAAGGAIELTLTREKPNVPSHNHTDHINTTTQSEINFPVMGYAALVGNTFCMASYVLIQKRFIFNRMNCRWRDYPVTVTAYSYTFGAIFMGLSTIYLAATNQADHFILPGNAWYALVYAVFITSALCYLLVTWSNMHLSATIVTAFWPFQVLVAVLASFFITGDVLAPLQYLGTVMLLVALFLVLLANHMDERLKEGKSVIRLDVCCKSRDKVHVGSISSEREKEVDGVQVYDENTALIKGGHTGSKNYDESMHSLKGRLN